MQTNSIYVYIYDWYFTVWKADSLKALRVELTVTVLEFTHPKAFTKHLWCANQRSDPQDTVQKMASKPIYMECRYLQETG